MSQYDDDANRLNEDYDYDEDVECDRCGKRGLEWLHTGERWRLMAGKTFHVCALSADGFGVVVKP